MEGSDFYRRHSGEARRLLESFRQQLLTDVMPFWTQRVEDHEFGGYFNDFDRFGNRTGDEKPGWFVGRDLYTFSMMSRLFGPSDRWLELARVGRAQLDTGFSRGDGRFNQMMARDGQVINGFTSIFTDHFVVKGLFEYLRAAGLENDPAERALARRLAEQLFADVQDPAVLAVEHIPAGMRKHAVNFMTLVVALESRALFENNFNPVLCDCVENSLYRFANDSLAAPLEYISLEGEPVLRGEGRLVDPGHTMESLWFSIHAGAALGRPDWIRRAAQVMDWVIDRTYDREYGGFYQHVDVSLPKPEEPFLFTQYDAWRADWDDKIWWVQAESLYALAASALYLENERHWDYFTRMAAYVEQAFHDRQYGEWYAILHRDGTVRADCKGFSLKGPYHVPRCLANLTVLLEEYLSRGQALIGGVEGVS